MAPSTSFCLSEIPPGTSRHFPTPQRTVPDAYPAVVVDANDSIVNFGTIELHFHQSALSHASGFLLGIAQASLKLDDVPDHDATRAELILRLGATEEQIRDVNVVWLTRSRK